MSADPASLTREAIHALVDQLDDESLEGVLLQLTMEFAPPSRPLSAAERAQVEASLAESGQGRGISTEELRRRLGRNP